MILNSKLLDNLVSQITHLIPSGMVNISEDIQKNMKSLLQGVFAKLDFVTRDEFNAQMEILHRTRQKLEALEKDLQSLESLLDEKQPSLSSE